MRSVLTFLFIFIGISPLSAAPVPAVNTSNVRHPNLAAGTTVRITEPIYLRDVRDYILDGQNTLIEYAGPAGVPAIIELGSCLNCTVKNFRIVDLSGADAAVLIGNLPNKVLAAEYRTILPDEKLIAADLRKTQQMLERRGLKGRGRSTRTGRKSK